MDSESILAVLFIIGGIFFVGILILGFCANIGNMADGVATDSIARISQGGWVWKTWRVQLTNDHPIEGNPMYYGLDYHNQQLIEDLEHYAETGERVKLYYRSDLINWQWEYPDAEVIYKVEPVKSQGA